MLISNRFSSHCDLFLERNLVYLPGLFKYMLNQHNYASLDEISERIRLKKCQIQYSRYDGIPKIVVKIRKKGVSLSTCTVYVLNFLTYMFSIHNNLQSDIK